MAGTARDFAQIGCCGAKSGVPRKLFSASAGALPNLIDGSRRRNRCDARVRANDDALRNAQLFSRFFFANAFVVGVRAAASTTAPRALSRRFCRVRRGNAPAHSCCKSVDSGKNRD
jgi:hypothetical protein